MNNITPQKAGKNFEINMRLILENKFNTTLPEEKISINGKEKSFDYLNNVLYIVGDAKFMTYTKSGNIPSGKISDINSTVWAMQLLDKFSKYRWTKFLVLGNSEKFAKYYVSKYKLWLGDMSIYYFDSINLKTLT